MPLRKDPPVWFLTSVTTSLPGGRPGPVFDVFGIGGAAQAVGSVAAAGIQAGAIKDAASRQAQSADKAQDLLQGRYNQSRLDQDPFREAGSHQIVNAEAKLDGWEENSERSFNQLQGYVPTLPGQFTQAELEATPGYQFTLSQGLRAAQNAAAARGLGVSGAALKAAADYATGLSDSTFNQRWSQRQQDFQNQQTVFGDQNALFNGRQGLTQNSYNRLLGIVGLGQNAAAQTGNSGVALGNAAAGQIAAAGNAQAAAGIAGGNALAGGINGAANAYAQNELLKQYLGGGSGGGGGYDFYGSSGGGTPYTGSYQRSGVSDGFYD